MPSHFAATPSGVNLLAIAYYDAAFRAGIVTPCRKNYFLASIAGFTLTSLLCGMATSLLALILFRVLQGAFGGGLLESSPQDWSDTFALNALHAAHAIRVAVPHFEARGGGSALIISSITGWKSGPQSSYAAAKAAEIHLAAALGQELGSRNIRVNALSPGSVLFPGGGWQDFADAQPGRFAAFAAGDFPRGRLVDIAEVADTACFVLSPRGSGISGANICVDAAQDHPSASRLF